MGSSCQPFLFIRGLAEEPQLRAPVPWQVPCEGGTCAGVAGLACPRGSGCRCRCSHQRISLQARGDSLPQ